MKSFHPLALAAAAACALSACGGNGDDGDKAPVNAAPPGVFGIQTRSYDGASDDLLTAGLGTAGLRAPRFSGTSAWAPSAPARSRRRWPHRPASCGCPSWR